MMDGGNIQLPFGYVCHENEGGELQFNLPFNFKNDILFDRLPYVAHLQNPAIDNVIKRGKVDDIALQKYLLATGLMQDTIQENLNVAVTDGNFNNTSVRSELDTKYPSVIKKSNPVDAVLKDKAKFDVQNPVVGSLIAQVQENKAKEKAYLKQLGQVPAGFDIDIGRWLQELGDFNEGRVNNRNNNDDNNDAEDGPPGVPPTPPIPPSSLRGRTSGNFPTPPHTPADDTDGTNVNLNPTQCFLLQRPRAGGERVAEAIGQELTRTTQRVTFFDNVTRVFPQAQKIMEKPDDIDEIDDDASISEIQTAARELN